MDESWRMRMGIPGLPRRRSTEDSSKKFAGTGVLDPNDFSDVFGGPPRSVLSFQFSDGFGAKQSKSIYEEMFRPPDFVSTENKRGRNLPAFRIPTKDEGFYRDIFRSENERRSTERWRTKSRSNSSSVLSSEELSPLLSVTRDDVSLSPFASKLRPINIPPCRWNSPKMMPEEHQNKQDRPVFPSPVSTSADAQYMGNEFMGNCTSFYHGFPRPMSSPETIILKPDSYQSMKVSTDDVELNSPLSAVSSLCHEPEAKAQTQEKTRLEEDEDEVMSSYVIEINCDKRESVGIDEAIAWAKEKFQRHTSETDLSMKLNDNKQYIEVEGSQDGPFEVDQQMNENGIRQSPKEEKPVDFIAEEGKPQLEKDRIMEILDEDIRLWSGGKETNIHLLLSTLHHILWENSGWQTISLTNLIGSSQVKKAYQKARLCLHPDKLQQRGATEPQRYVAVKAFSILQEAWAVFISQDGFFN